MSYQFFSKKIKNRNGQFLVEGVLLMSLSIGLMLFAVKQIREKKVIAKMIESPWNHSSGMIECGIWGPSKQTCGKHPNITGGSTGRGSTLVELTR